jgi:hypothetical protein
MIFAGTWVDSKFSARALWNNLPSLSSSYGLSCLMNIRAQLPAE